MAWPFSVAGFSCVVDVSGDFSSLLTSALASAVSSVAGGAAAVVFDDGRLGGVTFDSEPTQPVSSNGVLSSNRSAVRNATFIDSPLEDDEAEPIEAQPGLPDEAAYYRKGFGVRKAAGAVEMTNDQVPMTN